MWGGGTDDSERFVPKEGINYDSAMHQTVSTAENFQAKKWESESRCCGEAADLHYTRLMCLY